MNSWYRSSGNNKSVYLCNGKTGAAASHHPAVGYDHPDSQRAGRFVARVDGYVKDLFVPSAGQLVEKDAP